MSPVAGVLIVCSSLFFDPLPSTVYDRVVSPQTSGSFVIESSTSSDGICHPLFTPYSPHEGDLVFFDDGSVFWGVLYKIAWTGPPFHTGMIVKRPDGCLALLEAGPNDTDNIYLLDVLPRLQAFKGLIRIRRLKYDLSPEQSAAMTHFAVEQEGKRYAAWRLLLQGTPFRARGPLRSRLFGATKVNRDSWLCAELAIAAGTVAGIFNPQLIYSNCTYPIDIVDNSVHPELSHVYLDAVVWSACPSLP